MKINFNDVVPIYIQIADAIEDDIITGRLSAGENCYSQLVIARELNINPATAAKGIRLLVDRGVLNKVRGQAMTVGENAMERIKERKVAETMTRLVQELVSEAKKLQITPEQLQKMVLEQWESK